MKKILAGIIIFVAGTVCGLIFSYGSVHAQGSPNGSDIMSKLDEISMGQTEVIAAVNSMKDDIRTIKIRVTQMQ